MTRHVLLLGVILSIAMAPLVSAVANEADSARSSRVEREVHGAGDWQTRGGSKRATQRWDLAVQRTADGFLRGRIYIRDSPLMSDGLVEAHVSGNLVAGFITDEQGELVASFRGTVQGTRMSGTYTDRTGEAGDWEWDGSAAELVTP